MKEFGALFVAGYFISSLFLLPLLGLYLCLNIKKVSLAPIIAFHKALLLLSIALPIGMIMISCNSGPEMDFLRGDRSIQTEMPGNKSAFAFDAADAYDSFVPYPASSPFPSLQDVVFYFVDLICVFSILGFLIFVLRYALQAGHLSRIKKGAGISKIGTGCRLIESPRIRLPFSVGLFRKSIFIPDDIPPSEKKVFIQHELNHFGCHHHFWAFLERLLACIFWFNPIAHILRRRGAFLRELECDGRTIRMIDRYLYMRLLLKTAESVAAGAYNSQFLLMTQGWARKGELKMRIEKLMSRQNRKRHTIIWALLAVGVISTAGIGLLYGNLNDAETEAEVLAGITVQYRERAPLTARIDIEKVPAHFVDALLVSEDSGFYEHKGVNMASVIRAAGMNLKSYVSGGPPYLHGGSTITQQLAKQFINNPQRTLKRKFEELKIARVLEKNFTKDEILEMYLNMIYFGNEAFGLKAASDTYFGDDYTGLTLSESAMLVPFIKAPAKYNLLKDPNTAKKRQEYLLERITTATQGS